MKPYKDEYLVLLISNLIKSKVIKNSTSNKDTKYTIVCWTNIENISTVVNWVFERYAKLKTFANN